MCLLLYLKLSQQNQPDAAATANQLLNKKYLLYHKLGLTVKAIEVENLIGQLTVDS